MIRVLVVEDSLTMQAVLAEVLTTDPAIEIVGVANNGREGVRLAHGLKPDVITMDIRMPVMDGFEATRLIMQECPTRIVVVSASVNSPDLNISFNAIKAGALDVVEKPAGGGANFEIISERLISAVKLMSEVQVVRQRRPAGGTSSGIHPAPSFTNPSQPNIATGSGYYSAQRASATGFIPAVPASESGLSRAIADPNSPPKAPHGTPAILAVGSSTGGPAALSVFLKGLPANLPVPVVIVQHITSGFARGLVDWLQTECSLPLHIGTQDQRIYPGEVYFAPDDHHMVVYRRGILGLTSTPQVSYVRPSATVLFESVAANYANQALGVILTGMGNDGASGLKTIRDAGGTTFSQDQATCVVYGMPKAAVELDAVDYVLSLPTIAGQIRRICKV